MHDDILSPVSEQVLRFKPGVRVEILDAERILILHHRQRNILSQPLLPHLVPLIDGVRTVAAIVQACDHVPPNHVLHTLEYLLRSAYLQAVVAGPQAEEATLAYWELLRNHAAPLLSAAAGKQIAVHCLPAVAHLQASLCTSLQASGLQIAKEARLLIVLTDDYLRQELQELVAAAQAAGRALLLVKSDGLQPSFGPIIHPQMGSCLHCLQFWIRHNHPVEKLLAARHGEPACHLPPCHSQPGLQALFALVAASVSHLITLQEDRIPLRDHILSLDLARLETTRHRLPKRPQCPACGDPGWMQRQGQSMPHLQAVTDLQVKDGGYRQCDPGQTWERYQHLVSPVCGPLAYLHPMPRRHAGLRKVYVAGYLSCPQQMPEANNFDKICAGKGQTDEQARASALCEALERYSGVYQGDEACRRASLAQLQAEGEAALEFNHLQNFSVQQFAARARINAANPDRRRQIPLPCAADALVDWTPAWSLQSQTRVWVPLTYCFAEAPAASGADYGIHNPNGAAAGNCLEEAILQGFLELVERDATAIWWYNRLPLPRIALESFADPWFVRLQQDYARLGWELWALDLTHDLQIAVCAALAWHPQQERYAIGFGCHLSAHLALQRALTEVNQLFDPDDQKLCPWDKTLLPDAAFVRGSGEVRHAQQMPSRGGQDLQQDLAWCAATCAEHGMDMLVVNKTRPDIGLPVAQVIVPGLRHFWPRFGPGRLYQVPVKMGWLGQAKGEEELNPAPLFL